MEVRTHDNAWQATLNGLLDDIVELNKDKKWELSWQSFYDRFFDDYQDGTHDWLYSAPIEVVRRAAVMYADRAWKTMLWFIDQGYDHIHESEPTAVHDRLVAEGHLPKEAN